MARVFIPPPMRELTGGQTVVDVPGRTLVQVIDNLEQRYPGIRERLIDDEDSTRLMPGTAAVVDGDAVIDGLRHELAPDTEVHFLPAMAGGAL